MTQEQSLSLFSSSFYFPYLHVMKFNYVVFLVSWQSVLITSTSIFKSVCRIILLFFSPSTCLCFLYLNQKKENRDILKSSFLIFILYILLLCSIILHTYICLLICFVLSDERSLRSISLQIGFVDSFLFLSLTYGFPLSVCFPIQLYSQLNYSIQLLPILAELKTSSFSYLYDSLLWITCYFSNLSKAWVYSIYIQ